MPSYIVKLNDGERDWYLEYSTISDSFTCLGESREVFEEEYLEREMEHARKKLAERMGRVEAAGTSAMYPNQNPEELLSCNRAGPFEREATMEEIIRWYCTREDDEGDDEWAKWNAKLDRMRDGASS